MANVYMGEVVEKDLHECSLPKELHSYVLMDVVTFHVSEQLEVHLCICFWVHYLFLLVSFLAYSQLVCDKLLVFVRI